MLIGSFSGGDARGLEFEFHFSFFWNNCYHSCCLFKKKLFINTVDPNKKLTYA